MSAYALLWQLVKHVLHGRGRDEVFLHVTADAEDADDMAILSGALDDVSWTGNRDALMVLSATDRDGLL